MKHPRTIAAAALLLAACSDNPVAPRESATPMAPSSLRLSVASASAASELTLTISDIRERLIPLLDNAAASERLGTLMAGVQAAVDGGDVGAAHLLLLDARAVADPNGDGTTGDLGDAANVAVLRLTIENLVSATE